MIYEPGQQVLVRATHEPRAYARDGLVPIVIDQPSSDDNIPMLLYVDAADVVGPAPATPDEGGDPLVAAIRHGDIYEREYWAVQEVLDKALGTEEEDGSGGGIAAEVYLLMDQRDQARDALAAAEARIAAALADHVAYRPYPTQTSDWCKGCGKNYPCPTVRALSGQAAGPEWHCTRCGSTDWVAASLTGPVSLGGKAIRQCIPCGYYSNDPVEATGTEGGGGHE